MLGENGEAVNGMLSAKEPTIEMAGDSQSMPGLPRYHEQHTCHAEQVDKHHGWFMCSSGKVWGRDCVNQKNVATHQRRCITSRIQHLEPTLSSNTGATSP